MSGKTLKRQYFIGLVLIQLALFAVLLIWFFPSLNVNLIQQHCKDCDPVSAIAVAAQMGRLDLVSLCLAFLGLGVGFFAIFSFFAVKDEAENIAQVTAEKLVPELFNTQMKKVVREELEKLTKSGKIATKTSVTDDPDTVRNKTTPGITDDPDTEGAENQ